MLNRKMSVGTADEKSTKVKGASLSACIAAILLLAAGLMSCDDTHESDLKKMKPPIVVIAKGKIASYLRDKEGKIFVAKQGYYSEAFISSYNVGDTVR